MKKLQNTDPIISEAMSFCREALLSTPKDPDILLLRGITYLTSGQPKNAVLDFTEVIDSVPVNEKSYFLRSKAYHELDEFDLSLRDYIRAMRDGDHKSYSYTDEEIEVMTSSNTDVKDINNVTDLELQNTLALLAYKYSGSNAIKNLFNYVAGLPIKN